MRTKNDVQVNVAISFSTNPPSGEVETALAVVNIRQVGLQGMEGKSAARAVLDHVKRAFKNGEAEEVVGTSLAAAIEVAAAGGKVSA